MKRVERNSEKVEREIGSVSFEAEHLLVIIAKLMPGQTVTAERDEYRFESLDDIKTNIATFAGNPTIKCGGVRIEFNDGKCRVSKDWRSDVGAEQVESMFNELRYHKSIFDYFRDWRIATTLVVGGAFGIWISTLEGIISNLTSYEFLNILISVVIGQSIVSTVQEVLFWNKRKSVYYQPNQPFWSRHFETIIVGIVGPIIGAIITYLLTRPS